MKLEISRRGVKAILFEAARDPAKEVCGLLLGSGTRVSHVVPCRNVAASPDQEFEIDPAALVAAHKRERGGGPSIIGCYHSHPNGNLLPSERDGVAALKDMIWMIVTQGVFGCWRIEEDGQFQGGFAPINYRELPEGCTKVAPSPEGTNPFASYESHH